MKTTWVWRPKSSGPHNMTAQCHYGLNNQKGLGLNGLGHAEAGLHSATERANVESHNAENYKGVSTDETSRLNRRGAVFYGGSEGGLSNLKENGLSAIAEPPPIERIVGNATNSRVYCRTIDEVFQEVWSAKRF